MHKSPTKSGYDSNNDSDPMNSSNESGTDADVNELSSEGEADTTIGIDGHIQNEEPLKNLEEEFNLGEKFVKQDLNANEIGEIKPQGPPMQISSSFEPTVPVISTSEPQTSTSKKKSLSGGRKMPIYSSEICCSNDDGEEKIERKTVCLPKKLNFDDSESWSESVDCENEKDEESDEEDMFAERFTESALLQKSKG